MPALNYTSLYGTRYGDYTSSCGKEKNDNYASLCGTRCSDYTALCVMKYYDYTSLCGNEHKPLWAVKIARNRVCILIHIRTMIQKEESTQRTEVGGLMTNTMETSFSTPWRIRSFSI